MSTRRTMRPAIAAIATAVLLGGLGTSSVLAAAPDNDDSANARVVGAIPYADGPYDTTEATSAAGDPGFCYEPEAGPDRATVWYQFTPTVSDRYLVDTFGSDYDTTLYVGTPNGTGGMDVIDCVDDSQGVQSALVLDATAGTTYLLMVGTCCGSGTGGGGSLQFHVAVAPPPPTVDITVDGTGSFTRYGVATIHGSITCTNTSAPAAFDIAMSQRVGRFIIRGYGFTEVECSESPSPWSAEVPGDTGKFLGGHATVDISVWACGPAECADAFVHAEVRLRR